MVFLQSFLCNLVLLQSGPFRIWSLCYLVTSRSGPRRIVSLYNLVTLHSGPFVIRSLHSLSLWKLVPLPFVPILLFVTYLWPINNIAFNNNFTSIFIFKDTSFYSNTLYKFFLVNHQSYFLLVTHSLLKTDNVRNTSIVLPQLKFKAMTITFVCFQNCFMPKMLVNVIKYFPIFIGLFC